MSNIFKCTFCYTIFISRIINPYLGLEHIIRCPYCIYKTTLTIIPSLKNYSTFKFTKKLLKITDLL